MKKKSNRYLTVLYLLKFVFHGTLLVRSGLTDKRKRISWKESICFSFCYMTNLIFDCLLVLFCSAKETKKCSLYQWNIDRSDCQREGKKCYTLSTVRDREFSQTLNSYDLSINCIRRFDRASLIRIWQGIYKFRSKRKKLFYCPMAPYILR